MGLFLSKSLQKDPDVPLDASAAEVTAAAPDDPAAASLAEPSMSTRQESVGSFSRTADATTDSGSEGVGPAELSQSS